MRENAGSGRMNESKLSRVLFTNKLESCRLCAALSLSRSRSRARARSLSADLVKALRPAAKTLKLT